MNNEKAMVRIYYFPLSFPCGQQSSCCGPVGQSEEELRIYQTRLEEGIPGVEVQTIDASNKLNLGRDLPAIRLLNAFGAAACPIFAVGSEVVSMGPPPLAELVELVRAKVQATPVG